MGAGDFENWAKEDGAVLMSERGMVEMGGCILDVADDLIKPDVRLQFERDQKAGRHHAAASVSAACPDALVLVVSENRGITAFNAGNIVLWDA
jgi:DNA integrity scanning protein DisA with diadenylate cyclase activity